MMIVCQYCKKEFKSNKKYNVHLSLEHDVFKGGEDISMATIKSLEKKMDRVHFLLLKYPETRSPHNWNLYLIYSKIFSPNHLIVWDSNLKLYTFNPKEGLTEEQMKLLLIELDSVSRARRKLQELDRRMYHNNDLSVRVEHHCILPTEKAMHEAKISERTYREYFGKM
jgi:hypothetical protein